MLTKYDLHTEMFLRERSPHPIGLFKIKMIWGSQMTLRDLFTDVEEDWDIQMLHKFEAFPFQLGDVCRKAAKGNNFYFKATVQNIYVDTGSIKIELYTEAQGFLKQDYETFCDEFEIYEPVPK